MKRATAVVMGTLILSLGAAVPIAGAGEKAPSATAVKFFTLLFGTSAVQDPESAAALAKPGSPANAYAVHQAAAQRALNASGAGGGTYITAKAKGDTKVRLCPKGGLAGQQECFVFSKIKVDKKGRLVDFVNPSGGSVGDGVVLGTGQTASAFGVTFTLVSVFNSSGGVVIITDVQAPPDGERSVYGTESTYTEPGGRVVPVSSTSGPFSLQANVSTSMEFTVADSQELGGTLTIRLNSSAPDYDDGDAVLPTPAA